MNMKELENLTSFTIKEFQENFDNLINRVENGESFIIKDENRSVIIVPFRETIKYALNSLTNEDDEIIRLHADHEEGS